MGVFILFPPFFFSLNGWLLFLFLVLHFTSFYHFARPVAMVVGMLLLFHLQATMVLHFRKLNQIQTEYGLHYARAAGGSLR